MGLLKGLPGKGCMAKESMYTDNLTGNLARQVLLRGDEWNW